MTEVATVRGTENLDQTGPVRGRVNPFQAWIEARLAPRSVADQRWTVCDAHATTRVDHEAWTMFLGKYRRSDAAGVARLAYGAVQPGDRATLADYLRQLQSVRVDRLVRGEQFAFWVNLYNAATVNLILQHYPVKSIRAIGPRLSFGPWQMPIATVEGRQISLADVENRILRPIWRDCRIHYVLNCAAVGCPNLPDAALTRENSEAVLRAGPAAYVSSQRGLRRSARKIFGSSIYNWFKDDFGGANGLITHLSENVPLALGDALARRGRIDRFFYDWDLNDAV